MTYIEFTEEKPLTTEIKKWVNSVPEYFRWKLGGVESYNGLWKQDRRKRIGVYLSTDDAIVFRLVFGL